MTVNTELATAVFNWTGVESSFNAGFPADKVADLRVTYRTPAGVDYLLTLGVNYTASLASVTKIATVTPLTIPGGSGKIIVTRDTPALVPEVLADGQQFSLAVVQALHDKAAMRSAEDRNRLDRALVLKEGQSLGDGAFDLGGSSVDNAGPGLTGNSLVTLAQAQALSSVQGNVPAPILGQVGYFLRATAEGMFAWAEVLLSFLRYDAAQTLNDAQKVQARTNLGLSPGALGLDHALLVSANAGALTINLVDASGAAPSAVTPVSLVFPAATVSDGKPVRRDVTAGLSLTLSSGSTLGAAAINDAFAVWIVAFDDAGTIRLGAINCRNGDTVFPLGKTRLASAIAEGGAGAADSAATLYAGAAVTAKPYVVIGRLTWESGLATLGTWTAPSDIEIWRPGLPLPGDIVQSVRISDGVGGAASGSTPTQTATTATISLTSAANLVEAAAVGSGANLNAVGASYYQISRSTTFNGVGSTAVLFSLAQPTYGAIALDAIDKPNTKAPTAYVVFVWGGVGGSNHFVWLATHFVTTKSARMTLREIQT